MLRQHRSSRYRLCSAVVLVGVLGSLIGSPANIPGAQADSGPSLGFQLDLGGCPAGTAPASKKVSVEWRSAENELKGKTNVRSDSDGNWYLDPCWNRGVESGDVLKATVGTRVRTLIVPDLWISADRVTNIVGGDAPAGAALDLDVRVFAGWSSDSFKDYYATTSAAGDGTFSYDFTSVAKVRDAYIMATWTSAHGDTVQFDGGTSNIEVTRGSSAFDGRATPGALVTVQLLDSGLQPRATGLASTNQFGEFSGTFLNANELPVLVHAGDTVRDTTLASNLDWTVPAIPVSINAATDVVSGTCLPKLYFLLEGGRDGGLFIEGKTDAGGKFSRDVTSQENLRSGDPVTIMCKLATGDTVMRHVIVP